VTYSNNPGIVSSFARLFAGLSPRRPGLNPRLLHVGFVLNKEAKEYVLNNFRTGPMLKEL
jgi:hypothetical protein